MSLKEFIRKHCYWFVELDEVKKYYRLLKTGHQIKIKRFSGATKDLCTSGSSSGNPKYTKISKEQMELRFASEWFTMEYTGWEPGDKWAHLWYPQIREHKDNWFRRLQLSIRRKTENCLFLSYFDLDDKVCDKHYQQLKKFKPYLIVGYSEALNILAEYIIKNKLNDIRIPACISSAGHLLPEWRENIETAFRTKVYNRWGCSEFGTIAMEKKPGSGRFHVFTRRGLSVKNDGDRLLVTDINNRAQEFKDYDLGDTGTVMSDIIINLQGKIKTEKSYLRIRR